jgi:outer membrane protein OmpA-like peptidoglycan-associated protein
MRAGNQVSTVAAIALIVLAGCARPLSRELAPSANEIRSRDELGRWQEETLARQREEIARNQELLDELRRRHLDVRETSRGVVVNLPDVLFEFDRADLTRDARRTVRDIADVLLRSARGRQVSIEGHTDSIGSQPYNQRLSRLRAESVADALVSAGVNRRRLHTRGFGKNRPVAPNTLHGRDDPEGRAKNRRVEMIIENPRAPRGDDRPRHEERRRDGDRHQPRYEDRDRYDRER